MPCVVPRSTDLSPLFLPILAELFQQAEHHIAYKTRIARCINILGAGSIIYYGCLTMIATHE